MSLIIETPLVVLKMHFIDIINSRIENLAMLLVMGHGPLTKPIHNICVYKAMVVYH